MFKQASLEKYSLEMDMCLKHVENKAYWSLIWEEEDNVISLTPFLYVCVCVFHFWFFKKHSIHAIHMYVT